MEITKLINANLKIAIIGLGYVGLPLAMAFSKKFQVCGFDTKQARVRELANFFDRTNEVEKKELENSTCSYSDNLMDISDCDVFIITVPTPINKFKTPDLNPLIEASEAIGSILRKGNIVVYESTVYPGVTDDICIPILEKYSSLNVNTDFGVGYSPERVNPADKSKKLTMINKLVGASNEDSLNSLVSLYGSIISAKIYPTTSIKIAEAAKVIENVQRDVNIALINELSMIFKKMDLDTEEILKAAETKWNFIKFRPGLVGGHCIGVDPYYLVHKANELDFHAQMVSAGRKVNDGMVDHISVDFVSEMAKRKLLKPSTKVLIMGATFKANCSDVRNSKTIDLVQKLKNSGVNADIFDPVADASALKHQHEIDLIDKVEVSGYDAILLAVGHDIFKKMASEGLDKFCKSEYLLYDVSYVLPKNENTVRI